MFHSTVAGDAVTYPLEPGPGTAGPAVGSTARAGLARLLGFVQRAGVERALAAVRLPVQERRTGFTPGSSRSPSITRHSVMRISDA
jgi:hypothetical protein